MSNGGKSEKNSTVGGDLTKGRLLTVKEAFIQRLNMSEHTGRAWIASGRIGFVRLGRSIRIPETEIDRLLSEGFVPSRKEARQRGSHVRRAVEAQRASQSSPTTAG